MRIDVGGDRFDRMRSEMRAQRDVWVLRRSRGRRVWWGLVLIAIGVAVMLGRYGVLTLGDYWHYWPALLIVAGLGHLLWPDAGQHPTRGLFPIGMGLWFFACEFHWYGLTYSNGWPVILVFAGLSMLARSLFERERDGGEESHV